jgi:predicted MFS family arabinose efflux permease
MDKEIAEGLRFLFGNRVLRTLAVMVGVFNLGSSAVFAVFVLYAVSPGPLGLDEFGFGLLMTGLAVGSVVGSLLADRLEAVLGRANLLAGAAVVVTGASVVPAFTSSAVVVGVAFFAWGLMIVCWNVVTVSLRQRIVPDRMLGRVNASYRLVAWGTQPLGAALGGVVGEVLGVRAVFIMAGGLTALVLLGRLIVTDDAIRAAEDEAATERTAGDPPPLADYSEQA